MNGTGYPRPASEAVSAVMRGNRKVDTQPELRVRSALHRAGLRFRKNFVVSEGGMLVTPDVVFPKHRVAVFVDGCYWHSCPKHGTRPRTNVGYWSLKLARNVERDRRVDRMLRSGGWTVIRAWEHECPEDVAMAVAAAVRPRLTGHMKG